MEVEIAWREPSLFARPIPATEATIEDACSGDGVESIKSRRDIERFRDELILGVAR